jgi:hypothetical protein
MSRSFVTNLPHYLNESGVIASSLPKSTRHLVENLSHLVAWVTAQPSAVVRPKFSCWRNIKRKSCGGAIDASIELESFDIVWHCLGCGDHGVISHWQNSVWDGGHR